MAVRQAEVVGALEFSSSSEITLHLPACMCSPRRPRLPTGAHEFSSSSELTLKGTYSATIKLNGHPITGDCQLIATDDH